MTSGHVNELQHVRFSFDDTQHRRNVYELITFIIKFFLIDYIFYARLQPYIIECWIELVELQSIVDCSYTGVFTRTGLGQRARAVLC